MFDLQSFKLSLVYKMLRNCHFLKHLWTSRLVRFNKCLIKNDLKTEIKQQSVTFEN